MESKQVHIGKLEATVKSLSEELIKVCQLLTVSKNFSSAIKRILTKRKLALQANGIIKKLQGDLKALVGKIKVKNTVTVSQEKILQETTEKLQRGQQELQETQQRLKQKEEEVN